MVKHTQRICRLLPTYCVGVFDHFVGLALKALIASTLQVLYDWNTDPSDTTNEINL